MRSTITVFCEAENHYRVWGAAPARFAEGRQNERSEFLSDAGESCVNYCEFKIINVMPNFQLSRILRWKRCI